MSRFNTSLVRLLVTTLALKFLFLALGCQNPANGPTDPLDFIVEGKRWNSTDPRNSPLGTLPKTETGTPVVPPPDNPDAFGPPAAAVPPQN